MKVGDERSPVSPQTVSALRLVPGSWRITDRDGEVLGFVAIDRIVAGRSCGGIRAGPGVTALEIERIARVMTLKCGFAGLAAGGAKGGVIVPDGCSPDERLARIEAFGRAAAFLLRSGVWSHGADMGTTDVDIARLRYAAGLGSAALSASPELAPAGGISSGSAAGLTVALATEAALEFLGVGVRGARVAILGLGAVGQAAMLFLSSAGARITAVSTLAGTLQNAEGLDAPSVIGSVRHVGDAVAREGAPPQALLDVACDAILLCGGSDVLNEVAANQLKARAVICGANIPFTDGVSDRLAARGVVVLPDFVAGVGGVLGSTLIAAAGATAFEVEAILRRHYRPRVSQTLAAAVARGATMIDEARRRALQVIEACDAAYGPETPGTMMPERLAAPAPIVQRIALAAERRSRGSTRLAGAARLLHSAAVNRCERVLAATYALGSVGP